MQKENKSGSLLFHMILQDYQKLKIKREKKLKELEKIKKRNQSKKIKEGNIFKWKSKKELIQKGKIKNNSKSF